MVKECIITHENVSEFGKVKREENLKFCTFLKGRADSEELDKQFKELHEKLFNNYDCTRCSNCCKTYNVVISESDILKNAKLFNVSEKEFTDKYLVLENGEFKTKSKPCNFLSEVGKCMLDDNKPKECVEYPYTNQKDRLFSLYSIIDSAEVCPIVYEILESLKKKYNFKRS